jgi:hypothetical protein
VRQLGQLQHTYPRFNFPLRLTTGLTALTRDGNSHAFMRVNSDFRSVSLVPNSAGSIMLLACSATTMLRRWARHAGRARPACYSCLSNLDSDDVVIPERRRQRQHKPWVRLDER